MRLEVRALKAWLELRAVVCHALIRLGLACYEVALACLDQVRELSC